ncbi:hypothetical protein KIN20_002216 [Parelaphostrongylus tenuis]|uniref:Uncharacterized protein n=1 Tax=Parelaphostrongylus tenuis TaxID=148309 RepID=A0AAD5LZG3_PARTN|nr:hypothetical protein KIN20_002216 [Parelaphostrongylus tenuis]
MLQQKEIPIILFEWNALGVNYVAAKLINFEEAGRTTRLVEDEPYYHGFMTREEAEKILKKDGEFLGKLQSSNAPQHD